MRLYLRKIFPHDITHEVSVTRDVIKNFFDEKDKFIIIGVNSKKSGEISINNATDPRFGGEFKKILTEEGGIVDEDLLIFHENANNYSIEIIKKEDNRYNTFASLFEKKNRHAIFVIDNENIGLEPSKLINKPYQRIFFGAPGTGKSYQLNEEAKKYFGENFERVTFHPNYTYGAFVGAYKPFPKYIEKKETITYKYVQGAFMRVLVKALLNPLKNYLLIIEEINRANVSAVFGDVFQLLDRNKEGFSEYPVYASEEIRLYMNEEIMDNDNVTEDQKNYIRSLLGDDLSKLLIPSNMYIWSTMNSADQGVMPMDTAFKRRWDFEYIGIDKGVTEEFNKYKLQFGENKLAKWNDFRVEVNKKLGKCKVPEDKMMGPYFISKEVLEKEDIEMTTETVKNKVMMYLYEDAGKQHKNNLFVAEKASTYSSLITNFSKDGNGVFKEGLDIDTEQIESIEEGISNPEQIDNTEE